MPSYSKLKKQLAKNTAAGIEVARIDYSENRMLLAHLGADEVDELDAPVEIQPQLLHNPVEVEAVLSGAVLQEGAIGVEPRAAEQA